MRRFKAILMAFVLTFAAALWVAPGAQASIVTGGGRNQLSSRLPFRLDLHTGQGAGNESGPFRLYLDAACTQEAPAWRYRGSTAWAVLWTETKNATSTMITIPIVNVDDTGTDAGLHYTTYWGKNSDLQYVISGTGHFNGTSWDQTKWWNHLPGNITYTSIHPGDIEKVYVGNNVDGFQVNPTALSGYYELDTGDYSARIMWGYLSEYTYYDSDHTDAKNAIYQWNETEQPWTTAGLHQGTNTTSFAGMDWSGNFLTGSRTLRWDTLAPILSNTIMTTTHNGWLNQQIVSTNSYSISGRDNTSQTTDVSGIHASSLRFSVDSSSAYGSYIGTSTPSSVTGTATHTDSLSSLAGQIGQGTHTLYYNMFDVAGNTGVASQQIKIDTAPPACTPSQAKSDWHTGVKPITLTYADATSGVSTQQYSWSQSSTDAETWNNYTNGKQLTPPDDGQWYLHWQATDVAGNSSSGVFGPYSTDVYLAAKIQTPNSSYFIDGDVITSVKVSDKSATPVLPGDSAVLTLTVKKPDGSVYTTQNKTIVCPADETNLIWFKWHTPQASGTYTITASITAPDATPQSSWVDNLSWSVSTLFENTPPNPLAPDRLTDFTIPAVPSRTSLPNATWDEWSYASGTFTQTTYHASLIAALKLAPGPNTPTSFFSAGQWEMKSGYGLTEKESVSTISDQPDAVTSVQAVTSFYPEFDYETYNRNLEQTSAGVFELPVNIYSIFQSRVHFTPVDFPDGAYTVQSYAYNTWSPAGMLSTYSNDTLNIKGAVFDDWYTHPGY